jgi:hypothetical protein
MNDVPSSAQEPPGLELGRLLSSIQRGGAHYPDAWDRVVTFSSRRSPHEIDAGKFEEFQRALLERAGIRLRLVGAKYGCTDAFFEVSVPDPGKASQTYSIRTNFQDATEVRAMLIAVLQHDAHLRSLAVAAGFPTLRAHVNLDLSSNVDSQGTPAEVMFQSDHSHHVYNAPVGVASRTADTGTVSVQPASTPQDASRP